MGIFLDFQGQITPVCGPTWPKFKLLLDIMHVLDTYKFKMDRIKSNREKVATSVCLTVKGYKICSRWSDLAKFRTHSSSYVCHRYLQERKGSNVNS